MTVGRRARKTEAAKLDISSISPECHHPKVGVGMKQPNFVVETKLVRRLASNPACDWTFTKHSLDEMADETPPLTQPDIEEILVHGRVVLIEFKKNELLRVRGKDFDGRTVEVVVVVDESDNAIKIITAFCVKAKR
jgi:Domain of unknown function (DUF4258)